MDEEMTESIPVLLLLTLLCEASQSAFELDLVSAAARCFLQPRELV